jgi:hypothetical protein
MYITLGYSGDKLKYVWKYGTFQFQFNNLSLQDSTNGWRVSHVGTIAT